MIILQYKYLCSPQNHRMDWLRRDLNIPPVPNPHHGHRCLPPAKGHHLTPGSSWIQPAHSSPTEQPTLQIQSGDEGVTWDRVEGPTEVLSRWQDTRLARQNLLRLRPHVRPLCLAWALTLLAWWSALCSYQAHWPVIPRVFLSTF